MAGPTPSPYARFDRHEWDALADRTPLPLTQEDIDQIASLGDPIDMTEVDTTLPAPVGPPPALHRRASAHLR